MGNLITQGAVTITAENCKKYVSYNSDQPHSNSIDRSFNGVFIEADSTFGKSLKKGAAAGLCCATFLGIPLLKALDFLF